MTISASDITFFVGSGASAPFGIPTMKRMTLEFENRLTGEEKQVYEEITTVLRRNNTIEIDIEGVLSVINLSNIPSFFLLPLMLHYNNLLICIPVHEISDLVFSFVSSPIFLTL